METTILEPVATNSIINLLTAADSKLGVVGSLVFFIAYLIWEQKKRDKTNQDAREEERKRGERMEKILETNANTNELLKEILVSFRSDMMADIREIRSDIKEMNNKFR